MRGTIVGAWALFFGFALIMLGNGLQGTLLGLRATMEGFPTAVTGAVMSGYFIGFLAGSTLAPRLVARVGHVRVFAALASLASVAVLLHSVVLDPASWTAMRVVTGFSYAGLYVVVESWLNDRATNQTRGRILSLYMIVMLTGMAGGQYLLNLADPGGYTLFILVSVLVSLALVPILLTPAPAPDVAELRPVGLGTLYRTSPLGIVGALGVGMAHGALFGMGAVYAATLGFPVAGTAVFMSLPILGGAVLQWPIGRLSDRLDRRRVIAAVTFLAALAATGAASAGSVSQTALFILVALFGGLSLPMYSLCMAHTNDHLTSEEMVAASAGLVLVVGAGASFGPISAAGLMALAGPEGLFLYLAAVHGAVGLFALYRMARRAPMPVAEQGDYVAMPPRASPVSAALAPQGEEGAGIETVGEDVAEPCPEPVACAAGAD